MKRELIVACLTLALCSSCATHRGQTELPSSSPRAPEIQKALNQTVIPKVDLEYVTPEYAVKMWAELSQQYHPQHFEFRHAISHPMVFAPQQARPGGQPVASSTTPSQPVVHVTVRRKNITSARLLDEICQQSNYVWTIMGRMIVLRPRSSLPPNAQP
jgi:hypothetical protein